MQDSPAPLHGMTFCCQPCLSWTSPHFLNPGNFLSLLSAYLQLLLFALLLSVCLFLQLWGDFVPGHSSGSFFDPTCWTETLVVLWFLVSVCMPYEFSPCEKVSETPSPSRCLTGGERYNVALPTRKREAHTQWFNEMYQNFIVIIFLSLVCTAVRWKRASVGSVSSIRLQYVIFWSV